MGRPITFVFKEDTIKGELENKRGRDWHAELKNSSQVELHYEI